MLQLTTSFPTTVSSTSGAFVLRLVESLPAPLASIVLVPATTAPSGLAGGKRYRIRCFRYGPWRWQRLAHLPGGIPVALKRAPALLVMLPLFLAAMLVSCAWHLRHAQLVHAHWSVNGVVGGLVARLLRKPCITTLWGEDVTRAYTSRGYRWILALCLRLNDRVVCVSQAMHRQVCQRFPRHAHKVVYIPNGVAAALADAPAEPRPASRFAVVYVGSLIERKGVDLLVRAWAALSPGEHPGWTLILVGSGPEESTLRALAESLGVAGQVRFTGSVSPDDVGRHYWQADAFVLPSRSEGMPSVLLEAMASGLPVVATRIDGVEELVTAEREGLLFPVGGQLKLAAHLQRLAADPALRVRMGAASRQRVRTGGFLWPDVGSQYGALYLDALANGAAGKAVAT